MEKKRKEYDVPEELAVLIDDFSALIMLRERYIKIPFGYKKAVKCTIKAERSKRLFWRKIDELYPVLRDEQLNINDRHNRVFVAVKDSN